MSALLTLGCIAIGAVDLAFAIVLALMVDRGFVHAWLGWGVPLLVAGGLYMWAIVVRSFRQGRT